MGTFGNAVKWIFLFVIGSLIFTFIINPSSFTSFVQNAKSVGNSILSNVNSTNSGFEVISLKDLSQNPSIYVGKNISISGNMLLRGNGGYSLEDSNGYFTFIDNNCMGQRDYFVQGINTNSPYTYTAKGLFIAPSSNNPFSVEDSYRVSCYSPLQ